MGKSKFLVLLCVVLALCIGLYLWLPREHEEAAEPTPEPTRIPVISIPSEQIDTLSWEYAVRTLSFQRQADGWHYLEDAHFPMDNDSARFSAILQSLRSLYASHYLPDIEDPSEYGLDEPITNITVKRTDGTETRLILGTQNPITGEYYLQLAGDGGVYLIDPTLPSAFSCGLFDLVKTDDIPDFSAATEYRVNGTAYYYTEPTEGDGQPVWCLKTGNRYKAIDAEISDRLTRTLATLDWSACIDYYADSYELRNEYHLKNGNTVSVTYGDQEQPAVWTLVFGDAYDENHIVVSPRDSDLVYTLDNADADALLMK